MQKSAAILGVAALGLGTALGWYLHVPPAPVTAEVPSLAPGHAVADAGDAASREALRRRVKDLERELAAARAAAAPSSAATNVPVVASDDRRRGFRPPSPDDFRKHMEELREKDPARYAMITNRMAQFQAGHLNRVQHRLDILASVDTSHMSKAERATHDKLQELILREEELREMLRPDNTDVTDSERSEAMNELRTLNQQRHELERAERDTLLAQTARSFGVSGDNAAELVETVKAVYQATQSFGGHGGGPGGPPPGGPR